MTSFYETAPEQRLFDMLGDRTDITVGTAESLTAGAVAARIARPAGASTYLNGGIVSYAYAVKRDVLGVPADVLENPGAVSELCARLMAEGVRERLGTTFAVSTTGIAGPTGGTNRKPVGLMYIAVAGPDGTICEEHVFPGDRVAITSASTERALSLLVDTIERHVTTAHLARTEETSV